MNGIVIIGALTAFALFCIAAKPSQAAAYGMEDTPVSIDNIRKGVERGWYSCVLVLVDGIPAVHLTGKTADGKTYSDVYPVTKEDWETLRNEGYEVKL